LRGTLSEPGDPRGWRGVPVDGGGRPALSDKYFVIPELCTECVGHYDKPQCVHACPVDCIAVDPAHAESREQLRNKAKELKLGE